MNEADVKKTIRAYEKHKRNATWAAKELGIGPSTMRGRIIRLKQQGRIKEDIKPVRKPTGKKKGTGNKAMTRQEFMSIYDTNTKIREGIRRGLKALTGDDVVRDVDFRTDWCGVSNATGWRSVAEEEEFAEYQFVCDGVRWALPETVEWAVESIPKARPLQ
jgi:hypothetical protein